MTIKGEARRDIPQGDEDGSHRTTGTWPGERSTSAMTYMALKSALDGNVLDWLEPVGDVRHRNTDL